ncbi:hypothetical protein F2981_26125 (plasmid) [Sinorhizobium meliloti]|nr:hypothetical protein [Sinorhizobium meliloti]
MMIVENDADELHAMTQVLESWGASRSGGGLDCRCGGADAGNRQAPPTSCLVDYQLDEEDNGIETIHTLRALAEPKYRRSSFPPTGSGNSCSSVTKCPSPCSPSPVQLVRLRALIDWKTRALRGVRQTQTKVSDDIAGAAARLEAGKRSLGTGHNRTVDLRCVFFS